MVLVAPGYPEGTESWAEVSGTWWGMGVRVKGRSEGDGVGEYG
jgi:hypothetical protein